jgi:hypothetical protein
MFEKIIETKINSEKDKIKDLDFITMDSLMNSELTVFTKNFIALEAENISDRKSLYELIDKSVKLNLNYTLRPKWTILNFIFGKLDSKPTEDILNKLDIFPFYKYYPELISGSIEESGLVVATKDNIRSLIEEADTALHEKFTNNITGIKIRNFFLHMFKLRCEDESLIGLDSTIPYSFLRIFLEDKGFIDLIQKFNKIEGLRDDRDLDLMTIIKILTDKYSGDEDMFEPTPFVNKNELQKPEVETEIPKLTIPEPEDRNSFHEKKEIVQSFQTEIFEEPDAFTPKKIQDLFKKSELKAILKKVFNSDKASMNSAFNELNNIDNWYYASDYLKKLFLKNKVKIHDSKIVIFVDVLSAYFYKKESS